MKFAITLCFLALALLASVPLAHSGPAYVGTYTSGKSKGIYRLQLDPKTGELTDLQLAAETVNPSFLALHPNKQFLYAVNEVGQWKGTSNSGGISAFSIDAATGLLSPLNDQPTGGAAPCHLDLDQSGRFILVANYTGGSTAAFPIDASGRLGAASGFVQHEGSSVNPARQKGPHAHWVGVDSGDRFAWVADLGLDKVLVFRFDSEKGTLVPNSPPSASVKPGAGPRHFAFHPNGKFAYVINEIDSTLTAFSADLRNGTLTPIETLSTLPQGFSGNNSTAELEMHPSGKFLYGSNRGHNSIVVFAVNAANGKLTYVENEPTLGRIPRSFGIDPSGHFLLACNQNSDTIVTLRIDTSNGSLAPTGHAIDVPAPVCVRFLD